MSISSEFNRPAPLENMLSTPFFCVFTTFRSSLVFSALLPANVTDRITVLPPSFTVNATRAVPSFSLISVL